MAEAFVGRKHELAELRRAMDDAAAGHGQVVLVAGEAGIGKTRMADELAGYAASLGAVILWAACHAEEETPALWPWVQALRGCVRDSDDGAQLPHELTERRADPPRLPAQARLGMFKAVSALLRQAAAPALLLVLDDLQWADISSLLLFGFVARDLCGARILLVGMYRDVEVPQAHRLAEIISELPAGSRRLALGGLTEPEVGRLLALIVGASPSPELVAAVSRATAGNPLVVRAIGRL
ncbi:MAG: AAA family ATPase, partial [Egibacteraceae bacterium]